MITNRHGRQVAVVTLAGLASFVALGCGDSPPPAGASTSDAGDARTAPPTASISTELPGKPIVPVGGHGGGNGGVVHPEFVDGPAPGSAQAYLAEIDVLRTRSLPPTGDKESLAAALEQRNLKIVRLALQSIVATHDDPRSESLLNEAARRLFEARLQLALTGDEAHVRQLYSDAEDFAERDPDSTAAAVGALTLLRYAQSVAAKHGSKNPDWIAEYARQARLFAQDYPGEKEIAAPALGSAGRSCELHGIVDEAAKCYAILQARYPDTREGRLAAGSLRRLDLVGKPLQLKGATVDGGFTSVEDHRGRVVVVVFWNATAKSFRTQLPALKELQTKYGRFGLNLLGVNLDTEQAPVDAFVEKNDLQCPHLFHSDPARRGWKHPVAEWYGIHDVPTYFVVDHTGVVRHVANDTERLEDAIRTQLLRLRDAVQKQRGG